VLAKALLLFSRKERKHVERSTKEEKSYSEEATILAKAAIIIHNDIFSHQSFKLDGYFPSKCQENALPSSLKLLISLIYNSLNLKDQDKREFQVCLFIGQLIVFNMIKSTSCSTKERHHLDREPPLPMPQYTSAD